jgi:hypothetical protein
MKSPDAILNLQLLTGEKPGCDDHIHFHHTTTNREKTKQKYTFPSYGSIHPGRGHSGLLLPATEW